MAPPPKNTKQRILDLLQQRPGVALSTVELHELLCAEDPALQKRSVEGVVERLRAPGRRQLQVVDWHVTRSRPRPRFVVGTGEDTPYEPSIARIRHPELRRQRFAEWLKDYTPRPPAAAFKKKPPVTTPPAVRVATKRTKPATPFSILFPDL